MSGRSLRLVVVLALGALATCRAERTGWVKEYRKPLARQRAAIEGRACDEANERSCDPFVCRHGKCVVESCESERDCKRGSCVEGYCALPPPQPGRRCDAFDLDAADHVLDATGSPPKTHDPTVVEHLSRYEGCACRPNQWSETSTYAASTECGPFPCTANGCYVHACKSDEDCAHGFCASHTGWPDDWCVTSDDK